MARRLNMNSEELDRASETVAKKLDLYLDEQVETRLELEREQRRKGG